MKEDIIEDKNEFEIKKFYFSAILWILRHSEYVKYSYVWKV